MLLVPALARPWAFECSHRVATVATGKLFPAARLKVWNLC
jgi:hypothetical protein